MMSDFQTRCYGEDGMPVGTWNYCPNCGAKIIRNGVAEIS